MSAPRELRDPAAHGEPGGDETVDAEDVGERDDVVGTVAQIEPGRLDSAPVPALVECDDPVATVQLRDRRIPTEQTRREHRVQQKHGGSVLQSGVGDECGSTAG